MAEQKTKPTSTDIEGFLNGIDEKKREDSRRLIEMMSRVSGEPPVLWGSMVGFGSYHYRYASGREGDSFRIGFAPRKPEFSIYLMGSYLPQATAEREALLNRLGKHRMGKACLYVKKLDDIDLDVLEELARLSIRSLGETYGGGK